MLTNADRIYFIDPIQDTVSLSDRMLVLDAHRASVKVQYLNTIRNMKQTHAKEYFRAWRIDEDGNFVDGAPLNPPIYGGALPVLGFLADDVFVVGNGRRAVGAGLPIYNARRSDQKTVGFTTDNLGASATDWVLAAPWAHECMPLPTDNEVMVQAKLNIAKEKHRQRTAYAEILRQAGHRDWNNILDDVREEHDGIPTPEYGAYVTGEVYVPSTRRVSRTREEWSIEDRRMVEQIEERAMATDRGYYSSSIRVPVSFMAQVKGKDKAALDALQHTVYEGAMQNTFDAYGSRLVPSQIIPILRSAS